MKTVQLLLVEDDAVSAQFLREVLESLPATVVHAASCATALEKARTGRFDLWLVDANLPDGNAETLLGALRTAAGGTHVALALTADAFPERRDSLLAAGFEQVLVKPLAAHRLLQEVRAYVAGGSPKPTSGHVEDIALWDDARALHAAGGRVESVAALRMLFARELPLDRDRVLQALECDAREDAQDVLHRLKASCGFVGAGRLLAAVQDLSRDPADPACRQAFESACRSTLAGL